MMNRRAFVTGLGVVLAAPRVAEAQPATKVWRVGLLVGVAPPPPAFTRAFNGRLSALGYVEGQNLEILLRNYAGSPDRAAKMADELVALKPDVLVAMAPPAAHAAKQATTTIPVIFSAAGGPVETGLVSNLVRPGGNVTGLSLDVGPEINAKQLQILRDAIGGRMRISLLWNPNMVGINEYVDQATRAARIYSIQLQSLPIRSVDDLEPTFRAAAQNNSSAILALADTVMLVQRAKVVALAAVYRLPAMFPFREFPDAGGLMSYGPSLEAIYARTAEYVDKILKGAKPGDLPVEQPTKFELVINLKTAKALGLTIPPSLLLRADQVIE
jgi:putative ABC transport system substrate-binding protein